MTITSTRSHPLAAYSVSDLVYELSHKIAAQANAADNQFDDAHYAQRLISELSGYTRRGLSLADLGFLDFDQVFFEGGVESWVEANVQSCQRVASHWELVRELAEARGNQEAAVGAAQYYAEAAARLRTATADAVALGYEVAPLVVNEAERLAAADKELEEDWRFQALLRRAGQ